MSANRKLFLALQVALALSVLASLCCDAVPTVVGGLDNEREADDTIREVVKSVIKELEQKSNASYKKVEPISYRRQVVAGYNYFVKAIAHAQNGEKQTLHLRIYKPFRGSNQLTHFKKIQDSSDQKLEYFD